MLDIYNSSTKCINIHFFFGRVNIQYSCLRWSISNTMFSVVRMVTERKERNGERYNGKLWKIFISGRVHFNSALVVWIYGLFFFKYCHPYTNGETSILVRNERSFWSFIVRVSRTLCFHCNPSMDFHIHQAWRFHSRKTKNWLLYVTTY